MIMLTGGEKYNVKCLIIKIKDLYPKIEEIIQTENFSNNDKNLKALYNLILDIFTDSYKLLTTSIINSSSILTEVFNDLQFVYQYKDVRKENKEKLASVALKISNYQNELINIVESDTTNRDAVLRQIMDELGIVDPNAKKKKSIWD